MNYKGFYRERAPLERKAPAAKGVTIEFSEITYVMKPDKGIKMPW